MTIDTDQVMRTLARHFEVAGSGESTRQIEDAARRASADPRFREALTRLLSEDHSTGAEPFICKTLASLSSDDSEADDSEALAGMLTGLPTQMTCNAEVARSLWVSVRTVTENDPRLAIALAAALLAAVLIERSSIGGVNAQRLRNQTATRDIAAARDSWLRLTGPADHPQPDGQLGPADNRADETGLHPDPLQADTPAAFMAALRQYRTWAGQPSLRQISRRAGNTVAMSTLDRALHGDILPPLRIVIAIITGCGGSEEDKQQFVSAWRRVRAVSCPGTAARGSLRARWPVTRIRAGS